MKKTLLVLSLSFITFLGFSQEVPLKLALMAHPNVGFLKVENGKSNGQSMGFAYGLVGDFIFSDNYSITTGLLVTTVNGRGTMPNFYPYHPAGNPTALYDVKYMMQYLEVPLALKLKTDEVNDLSWYGKFGFTADFRLGAKQTVETGGTMLAEKVNATNNTSFFRAGMLIGAGAKHKVFGNTSLTGGLSYNNGLSNITKKGSSVKNHFINLDFGIVF